MTQQPPTDPATKTKPCKPLWRRILKWTFRVVLTLVVLAGVALAIFNYYASKQLQAEVAKIRAAGEPMTFFQLEKTLPKVKEENDAAPFYRAAMDLLRRSTDSNMSDLAEELEGLRDGRKGALPQGFAAVADQVLAANSLSLDMVDRASARPECAFDLGLSNGIGAVLPPLGRCRALARVLDLRTAWLMRKGQGEAAVDSFVSSLRMSRVCDRQPVLIANLTKMAIAGLCADHLSDLLEPDTLSDAQLAKVEAALAEVSRSPNLKQTWIADRVYALELSRTLISPQLEFEPGENPPQLPETWSHLGGPFLRLMTARTLAGYQGILQAADKPWPEVYDAMRQADARNGRSGLFGTLVPTAHPATLHMGRVLAALRSAQVAVLAERYRLAKGRLPQSLDELRQFAGHDLPLDPFTGKDLVYKVRGDGFMVYSVGDEKKDVGGPSQIVQGPSGTKSKKNFKNFGAEVRMPKAATASAATATAPDAATAPETK